MKAQQEDEEELFKEVEDDEDFSAPRELLASQIALFGRSS